ncbi:hypothetical protein IQ273_28620 [Nodosilinea sp. LEGE 07298]|uniref:hypothetical protein n=1 Tax=Nodosilinea sp. LEGE 07298 TaxID=2777970 RepID=UPI0018808C18|nr:hypothetical protein [Nodosilinea sp. LEGE 07298]MBE9113346.1 hypothetical protein [Nodosilinea sp. LEGE 07298]
MATVRLIVVVLVLGLVVLLGVQNLAPALPLVFLGGSTQALPLGVWLAGAVLLGALTTLVLTALLGSLGASSRSRAAAYKYRPQSFYEPTGSPSGPSAAAPASQAASDRRTPPYTNPASRAAGSGRSSSSPNDRPQGSDSADDDPSWRAWTNLRSPAQWNDWESLSRSSQPEPSSTASGTPLDTASGIIDGVTTWFSSSKQRAKQQQRVDESLRSLDDDWDGLENQPYRAAGVSPVQDSLDEISQGWEQSQTRYSSGDPGHNPGRAPGRNFEASQAPRRVYQDGSLYSYSYRDEDESPAPSGQVDNIYAPPDDVSYGSGPDPSYADSGTEYASETVYGFAPNETYNADPDDDPSPLGDPELAEDGVVDADYRVIVPPYSAAAEAAATAETWTSDSNDSVANQNGDDDWDAADDALTP